MITPEQIADAELIERDAYRAWVSNLTAGIPLQNAWSAAWSNVAELKMRQKLEQQMTPTEKQSVEKVTCPRCGDVDDQQIRIRNGMVFDTNTPVGWKCKKCGLEWGFEEAVIGAPASAGCPRCGAVGNHRMVVRNAMSVGSESGMAGAIAVDTVGSRCRHCDHEWGFVPI